MSMQHRRRWGAVLPALLAIILAFSLFGSPALPPHPAYALAGTTPGVTFDPLNATVGPESTVSVSVVGIAQAGSPLGLWTIDLGYDTTVVTAQSCSPGAGTSVCNASFAAGTVEVRGASASGLTEASVLATITFKATGSIGSLSRLTVNPATFVYQTPDNVPIPAANAMGTVAVAARSGGNTVISMSPGSAVLTPGATASMNLNVATPSLGSWTIDLTYNPAAVQITACQGVASGAQCNPAFDANKVRIFGATTGSGNQGLTGANTLATITVKGLPLGGAPSASSPFTLAGAALTDVAGNALSSALTTPVGTGLGDAAVTSGGNIALDPPSAVMETRSNAVVAVVANAPAGKLGSWTVDVAYGTGTAPSCVTLVDGQQCNTAYQAGVLRLTGTSTAGLSGTTTLALLNFSGGTTTAGPAALTATVQGFTDLSGADLKAAAPGSSGTVQVIAGGAPLITQVSISGLLAGGTPAAGTVTGNNFAGGATVASTNAQVAGITSANVSGGAISITVVPAGAGSFRLVVTNPDGGTMTSDQQFVTSPPSGGGGGGGGGGSSPPPTPTSSPTPAPTAIPGPTTPLPSGSSGPTNVTVSGGGTAEIGGGSTQPGGVTVSFPPNAVGADQTVTVSQTTADLSGDKLPAGTIRVGNRVIEVNLSQPGRLGAPVTLQIHLTAEEIAAAGGPDKIVIGRIEADGTITQLPTTVDPATGVATAVTDHFTKFTVLAVTRPGPVLTGPAEGTVLAGLGATLTWSNSAGTTQYQIQVLPFNMDGPGIDLIRNVETSYTVAAPDFGGANPNYVMLPDETYTWRVRTTKVTTFPQEGDWSAWTVGTFRTGTVSSGTITLARPADGGKVDSLTPTLTWANANKQVFYYEIQVSQDPSFTTDPATATAAVYWNLVHGGVTTPPDSWTVPAGYPLQAGATYYWRVRPRIQGDGVPAVWTTPHIFQTPE